MKFITTRHDKEVNDSNNMTERKQYIWIYKTFIGMIQHLRLT